MTLRQTPIAKTILLSIITLGIYYHIAVFRQSKDLHEGRPGAFGMWQLMFWLGFITFGVTWLVLIVFNFIEVGKIRTAAGLDNTTGVIALVLFLLTGIIGAIVWAVHWNDTVERVPAA